MLRSFVDSISGRITSPGNFLHHLGREHGCAAIFGAGGSGLTASGYLEAKGIQVSFFCDNDPYKVGTLVRGVPVLPPEHLREHPDIPVLIASDWARDIALQLQSLDIQDYSYFRPGWEEHFRPKTILGSLDELEEVYRLLENQSSRQTLLSLLEFRLTLDCGKLQVAPYEPYFHPVVQAAPREVIFDGGAWTGDTAIQFTRCLDSQCRVYAFEPDGENYSLLLETLEKEDPQRCVVPVKAGLWRENGSLAFTQCEEDSKQCRIDGNGDSRIDVVSLDSFASQEGIQVDLVKMDIEGAERDALRGARNTLARDRSKLQVCVYHRPDDLWKIALLLRELNPNYRLYLGHHTQNLLDTVLYAIDS